MSITYYFIRHAPTKAAPNLCYGQTDIPLVADYPRHHAQIKRALPPLDLVYSSPLSRCLQLAHDLNSQPVIDARLQELNFGLWEQCNFNHIAPLQLQQWSENYLTQAPPQGENFAQLLQRCHNFWHALAPLEGQNIAIVSHAGVIRALLSLSLNIAADKVFHFKVDYASIHCIKQHENWHELVFWNQTASV
jgi:alpha-ribazole phosphatase